MGLGLHFNTRTNSMGGGVGNRPTPYTYYVLIPERFIHYTKFYTHCHINQQPWTLTEPLFLADARSFQSLAIRESEL